MENLIKELSQDEKLMKRVAKDKVNGIREITITGVIWDAVGKSNWYKENQPNDSLESQAFTEKTFTPEFMTEVFNKLAQII